VVDSLSFLGVQGLELSLFQGGNVSNNYTTPLAIQYPDEDGFFSFYGLSPGQYFLIANESKGAHSSFVETDLYLISDPDSMKEEQRTILLTPISGQQ